MLDFLAARLPRVSRVDWQRRMASGEVVDERGVAFSERAGFYYEHWDELYVQWKGRIADLLARLERLTFPDLPDAIAPAEVFAARGVGRGFRPAERVA